MSGSSTASRWPTCAPWSTTSPPGHAAAHACASACPPSSARNPHIGSNGGTAAGLVGSYDTVAARIRQFHAIGIETFMLQFQPFEAEMRRFAHEVRPRVERLFAQAA